MICLSAAAIPTRKDGLTCAVLAKGYRRVIKTPEDLEILMRDIASQHKNLVSGRDIAFLIGAEIGKRPSAIIKLFTIKMMRSWYGTDSQRFEGIIFPLQIVYLVLVLLGSFRGLVQGNGL